MLSKFNIVYSKYEKQNRRKQRKRKNFQKKAQQIMNLIIQNAKIKNKNNKNRFLLKKIIKLQKLLTLFNVYVDLHFSLITRKFDIIINCNILLNEIKHKYFIMFFNSFAKALICFKIFKKLIDNVTFFNLINYFFSKNALKQLIRLNLLKT